MPGEVRLNVNVIGEGRVRERVRKFDPAMKLAQQPAAIAMAERVKKEAIELLREPKSGHGGEPWATPLIPRHWIQYIMPPGTNGGIPASQWGGLVGSIIVRGTKGGHATVEAGSGLDRKYAYWLELGFVHIMSKRRGQPRTIRMPFMRPALEAVDHELTGIVAQTIKRYFP